MPLPWRISLDESDDDNAMSQEDPTFSDDDELTVYEEIIPPISELKACSELCDCPADKVQQVWNAFPQELKSCVKGPMPCIRCLGRTRALWQQTRRHGPCVYRNAQHAPWCAGCKIFCCRSHTGNNKLCLAHDDDAKAHFEMCVPCEVQYARNFFLFCWRHGDNKWNTLPIFRKAMETATPTVAYPSAQQTEIPNGE